MNKKNKKNRIHYKICTYFLILIVLLLCKSSISYAASASIQLTSKEEVTVSERVTIILTVDSDVNIGEFEGFIRYDSDILEFQSAGGFIHGDDGLLKISDKSSNVGSSKKKYAMEFKAKKVGVSEISIGDIAVYDYEKGLEMSFSSNKLYVSVKSSKTTSTNANLKTLKISPGKLKPEFHKNTMQYTTTVANDIKELIVSGTPEDKNANILVSGATNLRSGENQVKVKVIAQSGDIKEYNIIVTKEEIGNDIKQTPLEDNKKDDSLIKDSINEDDLKVVNENGNIVIENSYRLQVTPVEPDTIVPSGYEKTSLILSGIKVTAYAKEDTENDFFLIYAMNEDGKKQFYQYDRVEKTMQRYLKVSSTNGNKVVSSEEQIANEKQKEVAQLYVIIVILVVLCIILVILIIRFYIKMKGYHLDDFE